MKTKKLTSILVLILIIAFAYSTYSISLADFKLSNNTNSYLADMTWSRSLDSSLAAAQQENKPVMIYFWAIWCQYCAGFQTNTLANPQIKPMLENDFILVAMDLDVDKEVSQKYGVSYPPYVVFLDTKGKVIDRISGGVGPETFLPIAMQVRDSVRGK